MLSFDDKFGFHAGMMSEYKISPYIHGFSLSCFTLKEELADCWLIYDDDYDDYYDDDYYYDDTAKYSTPAPQYVELPIFLKAVAEFPKTEL